jgi:hypothetical protein
MYNITHETPLLPLLPSHTRFHLLATVLLPRSGKSSLAEPCTRKRHDEFGRARLKCGRQVERWSLMKLRVGMQIKLLGALWVAHAKVPGLPLRGVKKACCVKKSEVLAIISPSAESLPNLAMPLASV